MQRVFQDWHQWLHEGLIDLAVPMNYARETDERVRGWFDGWIAWENRHKHGRQLAVGLGAYRNAPADTLAQIVRVRQAEGRHRADGVSFFSYASPRPEARASDAPASAGDRAVLAIDRLDFLATGASGAPAAFARPAPVPPMPWIERPDRGWIAGEVRATSVPRTAVAAGESSADGAAVNMRRSGFPLFARTRTTRADGNGYFGFTKVKPGRYRVWTDEGGRASTAVEVHVEAGKVARTNP
jgi:hypothetical protein